MGPGEGAALGAEAPRQVVGGTQRACAEAQRQAASGDGESMRSPASGLQASDPQAGYSFSSQTPEGQGGYTELSLFSINVPHFGAPFPSDSWRKISLLPGVIS